MHDRMYFSCCITWVKRRLAKLYAKRSRSSRTISTHSRLRPLSLFLTEADLVIVGAKRHFASTRATDFC